MEDVFDPERTAEYWDSVSRYRALTERESIILERAIRLVDRMKDGHTVISNRENSWSTDDDNLLIASKQDDKTFREISAMFNNRRSISACRSRWVRLTGQN